ncbi:MAG: DUF3237 family protein [Proteobacteria bacterium]|nr:DUF3237 family protein [Pseudomonadota bacterium]
MRLVLAVPLLLTILLSGGDAIAEPAAWPLVPQDPPRLKLVMQLVVTCSAPEKPGVAAESKDGRRTEIWPIVGGRFEGPGIRGTVVPGGGDFPVVRPDGVEVVDALYRLRTDDGVTIIIHNVGLTYPGAKPGEERYRLAPQFTAPVGRYDWLNRHLFIATLTDVPKGLELAKGAAENDRLIQVYQVD